MSAKTETGEFRSIKAAEAAGFRRMKAWEYGGDQITVKGAMLVKSPLTAQSETAWKRVGRKVIPGSTPHTFRSARVGDGGSSKSVTYGVYRIDQTVAVRKRRAAIHPAKSHPLNAANVLAAIFSVNRSAKRYRDAAQSSYLDGLYGFAKSHKVRKQSLYALKDRGLLFAFRAGFISATGLHGSLTIYRGGGYCFHSPLRPQNIDLPTVADETVFVEAKPRKASDMRLRDAEATLNQIPNDDENGFTRTSVPSPRYSRHATDDDEGEYCDDVEDDDWDDGIN